MVSFHKVTVLATATLALQNLAFATPLHKPRGEHDLPIDSILDPSMYKGACTDYQWEGDGSELAWSAANGWELTETFLDKVTQGDGSLDGWAQRLYNAVFPGASQSLMSCITRDAPCTIPEQCQEFEAKGNAGVWYILQSLMNFGAYMSEYENGIETLRNSLNDEVAKLTKDFTIPSAKTTDVQLGAAIAGSLNLAGSTLDGKMAGEPFKMLGALLTILAPKINGAQKPDVQSAESTEEMLHKWVNSTTNAMKDEILRVRTAVYGGWGGNEFVDIPESFLLPGSSKHPVTRLIADGKWLVKNPTANLADFFTETHRRAKQIMAFDSLKVQNHVVMVINDADQDKDACNSWTNNAWEDASGYAPYCYGMMWLAGEGDLRGGINDQGKPLWETYGLDKIETYRNVLDCWTKNDAQAGNLDTVNWDTRTNLPRCMFSMEVKKGLWSDDKDDCWDGQTIELDKVFLNFPVGSNDQLNRKHWPQGAPTNSPFCHGT